MEKKNSFFDNTTFIFTYSIKSIILLLVNMELQFLTWTLSLD